MPNSRRPGDVLIVAQTKLKLLERLPDDERGQEQWLASDVREPWVKLVIRIDGDGWQLVSVREES